MALACRIVSLLVILKAMSSYPANAAIGGYLFAPRDCRSAIALAQAAHPDLPAGLLGAIAQVESGRRGPSGRVEPWPWTVNVEGAGFFFSSKMAAIAAVRRFQSGGARSIDVGCMQINLAQHPNAFPDLEAALDPAANAAYASQFLRELHQQTGDWNTATGMYHSATPALAAAYRGKVLAAMPDAQTGGSASGLAIPLARAWAATLPARLVTPLPGAAFHPFVGSRPMALASATAGATGSARLRGMSLDDYRAMPIRAATVSARIRVFVRR